MSGLQKLRGRKQVSLSTLVFNLSWFLNPFKYSINVMDVPQMITQIIAYSLNVGYNLRTQLGSLGIEGMIKNVNHYVWAFQSFFAPIKELNPHRNDLRIKLCSPRYIIGTLASLPSSTFSSISLNHFPSHLPSFLCSPFTPWPRSEKYFWIFIVN